MCVEDLVEKQKKTTLFKVTEPSPLQNVCVECRHGARHGVCVYYCSTYYKLEAVRVGGGGLWRTVTYTAAYCGKRVYADTPGRR